MQIFSERYIWIFSERSKQIVTLEKCYINVQLKHVRKSINVRANIFWTY